MVLMSYWNDFVKKKWHPLDQLEWVVYTGCFIIEFKFNQIRHVFV